MFGVLKKYYQVFKLNIYIQFRLNLLKLLNLAKLIKKCAQLFQLQTDFSWYQNKTKQPKVLIIRS